MLTIVIPGIELFDDLKQEFTTHGELTLELEHSLVSLSKWESIYQKPFLDPDEKSQEETIGYIKAMTLTPNIPEDAYERLTNDGIQQINDYISASMTATTFHEFPGRSQRPNREKITAEIIYYWMISFNVPFECETWHLNRLFTLIRVANEKNSPPKKMSRREIAERNRQLNAQRRAQLNSKG